MYQVSIRLRFNDGVYGVGHICGAALISENVVLTAAHCLFDKTRLRHPSEFKIVAGESALFTKTNNSFVTTVKNLIVHPDYKCMNFHNDIAVIMLSDNIPSESTTLVPINLRTYEAKVGTQCYISGWGTTFYGGSISPFIRRAIVFIQDLHICNSSKSYKGALQNEMICAGPMEGGVDSCQGDSGGPLVCNNLLVGIVSNGNKCALRNTPGIYTDVRKYLQWILLNSSASSRSYKSLTLLFLPLFTKFIINI